MSAAAARRRAVLVAVAAALLGEGCGNPDAPRIQTAAPSASWERIAASLPDRADPESPNACGRGGVDCIEAVVAEMDRRFQVLAANCDHNAPFALMYLRVTEGVAATGSSDFEDPPFLNHRDAIFADLYFGAYDAWAAGEDEEVPEAWRIAFDAAGAREVSVLGDMMLGMNAHISRDLPFALVRTGLRTPAGLGARGDYDRVNALLGTVQDPMIAEQSELFDPSLLESSLPVLEVSGESFGELMSRWRTEAFENARRLIAAGPDQRREIGAEIEQAAAGRARVIEALSSNLVLGPGTEDRDAYCEAREARA